LGSTEVTARTGCQVTGTGRVAFAGSDTTIEPLTVWFFEL
jgi:hypothetical protein